MQHRQGLERYKAAQDDPIAGFDSALDELRAGCKQGHWIWYVFPQLSGLGTSTMARAYAIDSPAEAEEYLQDPVLRRRLLAITETVADRARAPGGISLERLMGSRVDVLKLVSSLTLFGTVARRLSKTAGSDEHASLARAAGEVLAAAKSQGYPPCAFTLARLED